MTDRFTKIRVVDTETTGIEDPCEMVEIGWTDVISRGNGAGSVIASDIPQSFLVNPGMPITFPAMAVHHIGLEEAATGIEADVAREMISQDVDVFCAHNWQFDSRFIRTDKPAICTFKCARTIWPHLQSHSNGSIRYELGLVPHGDPRAMPSHRAGPDTWVTAHILLALLKTHTVEQLVEITRNPVRLVKMPFGKHFGVPFSDVDTSYLEWLVHKSDMASDPSKADVIYTARAELVERGRRLV